MLFFSLLRNKVVVEWTPPVADSTYMHTYLHTVVARRNPSIDPHPCRTGESPAAVFLY